jgi:hypothetical protein
MSWWMINYSMIHLLHDVSLHDISVTISHWMLSFWLMPLVMQDVCLHDVWLHDVCMTSDCMTTYCMMSPCMISTNHYLRTHCPPKTVHSLTHCSLFLQRSISRFLWTFTTQLSCRVYPAPGPFLRDELARLWQNTTDWALKNFHHIELEVFTLITWNEITISFVLFRTITTPVAADIIHMIYWS